MTTKLNSTNFDVVIGNSKKPCVVKFYSRGCYVCRGLAPVYETLERKYGHKFNFYSVDTEESPDTSDPFLDGGVPTIQVFNTGMPPVLIEYPEEPNSVSGYSMDYLDKWLYFYLVSYSVIKGAKSNE